MQRSDIAKNDGKRVQPDAGAAGGSGAAIVREAAVDAVLEGLAGRA